MIVSLGTDISEPHSAIKGCFTWNSLFGSPQKSASRHLLVSRETSILNRILPRLRKWLFHVKHPLQGTLPQNCCFTWNSLFGSPQKSASRHLLVSRETSILNRILPRLRKWLFHVKHPFQGTPAPELLFHVEQPFCFPRGRHLDTCFVSRGTRILN